MSNVRTMLSARTRSRRQRQGNYALVSGLMIFILMGFGALAVDVTYMRLVQAQAQNVADAATQAALMELRATGSTVNAAAVADLIAAKNNVGGQPGNISEIDFGVWDPDLESFTSTNNGPNSVKVVIERRGADAVNLWLAPVLGYDSFEVGASAISASRPLHLILSIDSTASWSQGDFGNARAAVLELAELLTNSYGPQDMVGMNVFSGPWTYEFTPLSFIADIANDPAQEVLDQWGELNVMSRAGASQALGTECEGFWRETYFGQTSTYGVVQTSDGFFAYQGTYANYFDSPTGQCYPTMPREYWTEGGTDQSLGLQMSKVMFAKETNPSAFRAQILLTDGLPNGWGSRDSDRDGVDFTDSNNVTMWDWNQASNIWNPRALTPHFDPKTVAAHTETRYESILRDGASDAATVRTDSVDLAQQMWDDDRVHTYTVSFVADDDFLANMAQGQGYYTVTNDSSALIPMFQAIGRSLPMTLVQ